MLTGRLTDFTGQLPSGRLAIAFSGGGDSTALVHLCCHLRPSPLILIVDHALRENSSTESQKARLWAEGLGLEVRVLTWSHRGITSGVQEKARKARYALMGQVCRDENIEFLLTGHTRDDQAETLLMRYDRGTGWRGAAGMRPKIYAPLWPELACVTLLRPLLRASRQELRDYNQSQGLNWTDDPSNQDRGYARIRARQYLQFHTTASENLLKTADDLQAGLIAERKHLADYVKESVRVDKFGLIHVSAKLPTRLWALLLQAASGRGRPVDQEKLRVLKTSAGTSNFTAHTLAGAYVVRTRSGLTIGPDPALYKGRYNRAALSEQGLIAGQWTVWDGRFHIQTNVKQAQIMTTFQAQNEGLIDAKLIDMTGIAAFDAAMPMITHNGKIIAYLGHEPRSGTNIRSLVAQRLQAQL